MRHPLALSAALAVALSGGQALAVNLLSNPSFEAPINYDGPVLPGVWRAFSGANTPLAAATASSSVVTTFPLSGAQNLNLSILGGNDAYAGAFQDVIGLTPGSSVTFSGNHALGGAADVGVEFRIEWRNTVSNTEISRTANSTAAPLTTAYVPFSLTATVPAGVDTGRFVYAIQTFGGEPGPTNTGTIFLDDMRVVPEPTSALLAVAGLAAMIRRRR
jgi:hypothetical protein